MPQTSTTADAVAPTGASKPAIVLAWSFDGARLNAKWITTNAGTAAPNRRERVA